MLIAGNDRNPSDGHVTGLAAQHLVAGNQTAPTSPRPIVLASATTEPLAQTGYLSTPHTTTSTNPMLPPVAAPRPTLAANTLGTLPAGPSGAVRKPTSTSATGLLEALPPENGTPLDLGPVQKQPRPMQAKFEALPAGPGSIARAPAPRPLNDRPSRYGPSGNTLQPPEEDASYFTAPGRPASGTTAIDRLLAGTTPSRPVRIDLGAYKIGATADRVAELMRPYGSVSARPMKSGAGEMMTAVVLTLEPGALPGTVLDQAERLGIRDAIIMN